MVKIFNLSYGSSRLPRKENGYCGDFSCVASQYKAECRTGKFKRIIHQLVEKEEKKLLALHLFVLKDFNQVGFFTVERLSCSERNQSGKVFNEFSGATCTLTVKEVLFSNENLSIYSCFIDVLYDLRRILTLAFALMSSAAFKCVK